MKINGLPISVVTSLIPSFWGNDVIALWAISKGADVNAQLKCNMMKTPLHIALEFRHKKIVDILLESGAISKFTDENGNTAIEHEKQLHERAYGKSNETKSCYSLCDKVEFLSKSSLSYSNP